MTKRRSTEDIELNVASMLDMAFQLLTFFILTFKASPLEGQISLHMPPPQQVLGLGNEAAGSNENKTPDQAKPIPTLIIGVNSNDGSIEGIELGIPGKEAVQSVDFPQLRERLEKMFRDSAGAFEQVIIEASPRLYYRELMKIVEVSYQAQKAVNPDQKVGKLSFVSKEKAKPKPTS